MGIRITIFILAIITLLSPHDSASQKVYLETERPNSEGWKGRIHGMAQDGQGFLWLASTQGLYRYDGYNVTNYHNEPGNPNSLANDWIECMYGGKENFLLLGTFRAGLDRFDLATGKFTHYRYNVKDPTTISNDTVSALVKDKSGKFWIGTHNGLNLFDPKTGKFVRYMNNPDDPASLSDNQVFALYEDHEGVLWVGTKSPWEHDGGTRIGGLNRFDVKTGKFTRYMHKDSDVTSLIDNEVTAIFKDSRGTLWVGTAGDGLHTMNKEKSTFERHLFDPAHPEKLSRPPIYVNDPTQQKAYITFINEDSRGYIWIGTFDNGISVYDPVSRKTVHYGTNNSPGIFNAQKIKDFRFSTSYAAEDEIFWVASWDGDLYKVNPYKIALPYNFLGKDVNDFYEDNNGVLWVATFQGIFQKDKNNLKQLLIDKNAASDKNQINAIEEDNHQLWLGTGDGLYQFDPNTQKFTRFYHDSQQLASLNENVVTALKKANNNQLWVGTANGLDLMDISSGTFKHFKRNPEDSTSFGGTGFEDEGITRVNSIMISDNNTVWVCVGGAINRLNKEKNTFKKYILYGYPICIMEDSKGNIWVGTDNGLFHYKPQKDDFEPFYDQLKLINRNTPVYAITEDHKKNIWLKTPRGLVKLNVQRKEASIYKSDEHGISYPLMKSYTTRNGKILAGDTSGYFEFNPDSLLKNLSAPAISIIGFSLADQQLKTGANTILTKPLFQTDKINLKYNQNTFAFEFTSIDFTGDGKNRVLACLLENYDKLWHKAEDGTANYYNVPPGKYILKIKAKNSNGIWAEKDINVIISSPWWTSWWAYTSYGLCFLTIVFIVDRIQRKRLIAKERERTRERELAQARKIEKAYDELKSTQAQLIQQEKMASLGQLTAGIAHEIQNPLNFVNNFSEINTELLDELEEEAGKGNVEEVKAIAKDIKDNEQKIIHHGRRADSIIKGMLQHSRANTGKRELTDINALVDECVRLSYHGMRAKDKEFNAEIKTGFDDSVGKVNIVPQDISRVLLNLLNNAFYTIDEKKRQLNGMYEPTVSVCTKKLDGKVEIHVKDNGNGIPQNIEDKIFQPFFTTKPTGQGTGLGLSLSYDIIKAHGGEIKVETKDGEGSEFIVWLSLRENIN